MRRSHRLWRVARPLYLAWRKARGPDVFHGGPPAGVFSEADAVKRGEAEGGVSQPALTLRPVPAESEIVRAGLGQEAYTTWQSVWSMRDNARVLDPGHSHVDSSGRACIEAMHGPHHLTDPVFRRNRASRTTHVEECATSIISRWNDGTSYYHWFLDGLTRLSHLRQFPADTTILVPERLAGFAHRSIEILGLESRVMPAPAGDLHVARYAFAGPTMPSGCPDPQGVAWLRQTFLKESRGIPTPIRDIFIDRTANRRICLNAGEVAETFSRMGWEVVDPGTLDLDAQIRLFRQARRVAGIHGAGLTNLLWMKPGTSVLEIMPSRRRNGCYAAIAHCIGIRHHTWVIPSDRLANLTIPAEGIRRRLDGIEHLDSPRTST